MSPIPPPIRKLIDADPFYKVCALRGRWVELSFPIEGSMEFERRMTLHHCEGRITMEHTIIFAGKQVQALWAIVPICACGHEVDRWQDAGTMDKDANIWVALNRATDEELRAISKSTDYFWMRDNLNKKYGPYVVKTVEKPVDKLLKTTV